MNFKALALAAVASLSFGFLAPEAKATQCSYGDGYELCYEYQGVTDYGNQLWYVRVRNNHTTENMTVICDGYRMVTWRSRGGATHAQADVLARAFCAL